MKYGVKDSEGDVWSYRFTKKSEAIKELKWLRELNEPELKFTLVRFVSPKDREIERLKKEVARLKDAISQCCYSKTGAPF